MRLAALRRIISQLSTNTSDRSTRSFRLYLERLEDRLVLATHLNAVIVEPPPSDLAAMVDTMFTQIHDQLDSSVGQIGSLPLIGTKLQESVQPLLNSLGNGAAEVTQLVNNLFSQLAADPNADAGTILLTGLFRVFGPQGLNILKDGPDADTSIGTSDIVVTEGQDQDAQGNPIDGTEWFQWNMSLGQDFSLDVPLDFGLALPPELSGIGFQLGANGGLRIQANWDLDLGFGVDADQGYFLVSGSDTGPDLPELRFEANVSAAPGGLSANASLGALRVFATDGTVYPETGQYETSNLYVQGSVDLVEPSFNVAAFNPDFQGTANRLYVTEVQQGGGNWQQYVKPQFSWDGGLHMHVTSDPDLQGFLGGAGLGFIGEALQPPKLDFDFNVTGSGKLVTLPITGALAYRGGMDNLSFDNIEMDIAGLLDEVAQPLANVLGATMGPISDLLGPESFLVQPLPLISDLVGDDITILHLASGPAGIVFNDAIDAVIEGIGGIAQFTSAISDFLASYNGQPIPFGSWVWVPLIGKLVPREAVEALTFDLPPLDLPSVQLPNLQLPTISLPTVTLPGPIEVTLPDVPLPNISLPNITLPDLNIELPVLRLPNFRWPDIQLPEIDLPDITIPDIYLPDYDITLSFPTIALPNLTLPNLSLADIDLNLTLPDLTGVSLPIPDINVNIPLPSLTLPDFDLTIRRIGFPDLVVPIFHLPSYSLPNLSFTIVTPDIPLPGVPMPSLEIQAPAFSIPSDIQSSGFQLDVLKASEVVNMLLGKPFNIMRYNLPGFTPPLAIGAGFDLSFWPLDLRLSAGAGMTLFPTGMVYDSTGLQALANSQRTGGTVDWSSLLEGFYMPVPANGSPLFAINLDFSGYASIDATIAKAWLDAGFAGEIYLNVIDPNNDGKLRLTEIMAQTDNFNDPSRLLSMFDAGIGISAHLNAGGTIGVSPLSASFSLSDIGLSPNIDFSISLSELFPNYQIVATPPPPPPKLASEVTIDGQRVLRLNIGPYAADRLAGNTDDSGGADITVTGSPGNFLISGYGVTGQAYNGGYDYILAVGGDGNDQIDLAGVSGIVVRAFGGAGNDTIKTGSGSDYIEGGTGSNTIAAGSGDNTVVVVGIDNVTSGAGNDNVNFSKAAGGGSFSSSGGDDWVVGSRYADNFTSTSGIVHFEGRGGNDTLSGIGYLDGGAGNDSLTAGSGGSTLDGGFGDDTLTGGAGNDVLEGGGGTNTLAGAGGNDILYGGSGNDSLFGGSGNDVLYAGLGNQTLDGAGGPAAGAGIDRYYGGIGNDTLITAYGDTWVDGGLGSNALIVRSRFAPIVGGTISDGFLQSPSTGSTPYVNVDTVAMQLGDLGNAVTVNGVSRPFSITSGFGNDQVTVNRLSSPSPVPIDLGAGDDILTVQDTQAVLNATGGGFNVTGDVLVIDFSANLVSQTGTLNGGTISVVGMGDVNYSAFQFVNFNFGPGSDSFTVQDTAADVLRTQIQGGGGYDDFYVANATTQLRVYGNNLGAPNDGKLDTLHLIIPGDPTTLPDGKFNNVLFDIDRLRVDNTTNVGANADWSYLDGVLSVGIKTIVDAGTGTRAAYFDVGLAGQDSLSLEDSVPVSQVISIDQPQTTIQEGQDVLFYANSAALSFSVSDVQTADLLNPNDIVFFPGHPTGDYVGNPYSPNGQTAYVTSARGLTAYTYVPGSPNPYLTILQQFTIGAPEVLGLNNPHAVDVSPDGRFVYVGGDDGFTVFSRDTVTGRLRPLQNYDFGRSVSSMAVTNSGLYAAVDGVGFFGFARDGGSGLVLSQSQFLSNGGQNLQLWADPRERSDRRDVMFGVPAGVDTYFGGSNGTWGALIFPQYTIPTSFYVGGGGGTTTTLELTNPRLNRFGTDAPGQDIFVAVNADDVQEVTTDGFGPPTTIDYGPGSVLYVEYDGWGGPPGTALIGYGQPSYITGFVAGWAGSGPASVAVYGAAGNAVQIESDRLESGGFGEPTIFDYVSTANLSGYPGNIAPAGLLGFDPSPEHRVFAPIGPIGASTFTSFAELYSNFYFNPVFPDPVPARESASGETVTYPVNPLPGVDSVPLVHYGNRLYSLDSTHSALVYSQVNGSSVSLAQATYIDGINANSSVAVSADGGRVYVTVPGQVNWLLTYGVNGDGSLSYQSSTPLAGSPGHAAGSNGYVYVTMGNAVAIYAQNGNGTLSFIGNDLQAPLSNADNLQLIPTSGGTFLYVSSTGNNSVAVYKQNGNGTLSYVQTVQDDVGGIIGLANPGQIIGGMTPAGQTVLYVTGRAQNSIAAFLVDPNTGALTFTGHVRQGYKGVRGLQGIHGLSMTPDGKYLVASGRSSNSLAVFGVDPNTGKLTFLQRLLDGSGATQNLSNPQDVVAYGNEIIVSTGGPGVGFGTLTTFDIASTLPPPRVATIQYAGVDTLTLTSADGSDLITLRDVGMPLVVNGQDGGDQVTLLATSPNQPTTINVGGGGAVVNVLDTGAGSTVQINGTSGNNTFNVWNTQPGGSLVINGGPGNSTFNVAGWSPDYTRLQTPVTIIGGGANDTLNFNAGTQTTTPVVPPLPNGSVVVTGEPNGVNYTGVETLNIFASPVVKVFPVAAFAEGQGTSLDASGTLVPPGRTVTEVAWDIDADGSFGDYLGFNISLTWADLVDAGINRLGTYRVAVQVTLDTGAFDVGFATLTITDTPPTLFVTGLSSVRGGSEYQLDLDSSSVSIDLVQRWEVNWGDASPLSIVYGPTAAARHTYAKVPADTPYTITVTAFDAVSLVTGTGYSASKPITVLYVAPTVLALSGTSTSNEASSYTLNLSAAGPDAAKVQEWFILWGDGNTSQVVGATTSLNYTYPDDGLFVIRAFALWTDGSLSNVQSVVAVNVDNVAPTLNVSGGPATIDEGQTYTLNLSSSDPGADALIQWTINWGDGQASEVAGNTASLDHVYADDGAFTIQAQATDEDGTWPGLSTWQAGPAVTVSNVAPTITLTGPATINEVGPYVLGLAAADPGTDNITRWQIVWGDGTTSDVRGDQTGATHVYQGPSPPTTIYVTAYDEDSPVAGYTVNRPVEVLDVMPAPTITGDPRGAFEGSPYTVTLAAGDPGAPVDSWTVNWGDGNTDIIAARASNDIRLKLDGSTALLFVDGNFKVRFDYGAVLDGALATDATAGVTVGNVTTTNPGGGATGEETQATVDFGTAANQGSGLVIFDYASATDYKYAGVRNLGGRRAWVIGHADAAGQHDDVTRIEGVSEQATHIYANNQPGNAPYSVTATAHQGGSDYAATPLDVLILDADPEATVTGAPQVDATQAFSLDIGPIVDPGADTITEYRVQWGDGSTFGGNNWETFASGGTKTHVFADLAARHDVTVSVVDGDGLHILGSVTVVHEGTTYTTSLQELTGTLAGRTYRVAWGDGQSSTYDSSAPVTNGFLTAAHAYGDNGVYTIEVFLVDAQGQESLRGTSSVVISNVLNFAAGSGNRVINENQSLVINHIVDLTDPGFDNPAAAPPTVERFGYTIDWGDGSATDSGTARIDQAAVPDSAGLVSVDAQHVYQLRAADTSLSTYTVTITVTDDDGAVRQHTFDVDVYRPDFRIDAVALTPANELSLTYTLGNVAPGTPLDPRLFGVYRSADSAFDAGDEAMSQVLLDDPARLLSGQHGWTWAIGQPGGVTLPGAGVADVFLDYQLVSQIDPTGDVVELDETNNALLLTGHYRGVTPIPAVYVFGTAGRDVVTVAQGSVIVDLNGVVREYFDPVQQVSIRAHAGNDEIGTTYSGLGLVVFGGAGADRLVWLGDGGGSVMLQPEAAPATGRLTFNAAVDSFTVGMEQLAVGRVDELHLVLPANTGDSQIVSAILPAGGVLTTNQLASWTTFTGPVAPAVSFDVRHLWLDTGADTGQTVDFRIDPIQMGLEQLTLQTGPQDLVNFPISITLPGTLTVTGTGGTVRFGQDVNAAAIASFGATVLIDAATLTTTGSQSYQGAVQLAADATLVGSQLIFGGPLNGSHMLTLQGPATIGGDVGSSQPLAGILAFGPATVEAGQVVTQGDQAWLGPLFAQTLFTTNGGDFTTGAGMTLPDDTTVRTTGGDVQLGGPVVGPGRLVLDAGDGNVNATHPLGTGTLLGGLALFAGPAFLPGVSTQGNQLLQAGSLLIQGLFQTGGGSFDLAGPATLSGNTSVQTFGGTVGLDAPIDVGPFELLINAGNVFFNAPIRGLGSLFVSASTAFLNAPLLVGQLDGSVPEVRLNPLLGRPSDARAIMAEGGRILGLGFTEVLDLETALLLGLARLDTGAEIEGVSFAQPNPPETIAPNLRRRESGGETSRTDRQFWNWVLQSFEKAWQLWRGDETQHRPIQQLLDSIREWLQSLPDGADQNANRSGLESVETMDRLDPDALDDLFANTDLDPDTLDDLFANTTDLGTWFEEDVVDARMADFLTDALGLEPLPSDDWSTDAAPATASVATIGLAMAAALPAVWRTRPTKTDEDKKRPWVSVDEQGTEDDSLGSPRPQIESHRSEIESGRREIGYQTPHDEASPANSTGRPIGGRANYTVAQLRAEAKRRGLRGYSRLRKRELLQLLGAEVPSASDDPASRRTVAELRAEAKRRGLRGYTRLRKCELIELLT